MRINEQIRTTLSEYNIPENDGLAYLLSIYFNCRPSYTPPILVQKMNITNILGIGQNREVIWHIPLFENEDSIATWEWVSAWSSRFESINPLRKAPFKSVMLRMKAFFAENPDVRKEEVIEATNMYLRTVRDKQYLISPHYFISKGVGRDRTSALLGWVEKYRATMANPVEKQDPGEPDLRSTIQ
jgi:hypothetical protein